MKATVRFYDEFEGEDLDDIYRQVLEYLQEVVLSGDLGAFDIDRPQRGIFVDEEFVYTSPTDE